MGRRLWGYDRRRDDLPHDFVSNGGYPSMTDNSILRQEYERGRRDAFAEADAATSYRSQLHSDQLEVRYAEGVFDGRRQRVESPFGWFFFGVVVASVTFYLCRGFF